MNEVQVAFVLLWVFEDDLHDGGLFPVVELPLHLDVLPGAELEILSLDLSLKDRERSAFHGLRSGLGSRVVHDASIYEK